MFLVSFPEIFPRLTAPPLQIGEGAFGIVFKGVYNGKEVAIKQMKLEAGQSHKKFEEFKSEINIMRSLVHPNVVRMFGIATVPHLAVIMEFVPSGDLFHDFHAHDPNLSAEHSRLKALRRKWDADNQAFFASFAENNAVPGALHSLNERKTQLDRQWKEHLLRQAGFDRQHLSWRLRILTGLDIARGMRYLHSISPPVVHRDLRSPNVFLVSLEESASVRAKVADFGLSRKAVVSIGDMLHTWQWLGKAPT